MNQYNGEYGGRVLRPFKGGGMTFIKDAILSPETVMEWPLRNRIALHADHKVEWYGPIESEEISARSAVPEESTPTARGKKSLAETAKEGEKAPSEAQKESETTLGKLRDVAEALNGVLNLDPEISIELPEPELRNMVAASAALIGLDNDNQLSAQTVESDKGLFESDFPGTWEMMVELGLLAHLDPAK